VTVAASAANAAAAAAATVTNRPLILTRGRLATASRVLLFPGPSSL
jgi:hypothetical protein